MKTAFIFGAILLCSAIGAWTADSRVKNVFLLVSAGFSIYGLARIFG
ncbi:hypothetical protein [Pelomonas sp. KK5]|nr:hypothetical protein [Pelomonas sp. KK5]